MRLIRRAMFVGGVAAMSGLAVAPAAVAGEVSPPDPSQARLAAHVAPGCWNSQVGLYTAQRWPSSKAYCFTFDNDNFNSWPAIKDNVWSAWNGGTSGTDAVVFAYENQKGSYLCIPYNGQWSYTAKQRARSLAWEHRC